MITLYHGPKSCSVAVRAVLEVIGVDHNIKTVNLMGGEQFSDAYLQINPMGKVPALDMDGKILTEGGAILSILSELFPSSELMPPVGGDARAESLKWLFAMYNTVNPIYARIFMSDRYADNPESVKQKAEDELHRVFAMIDEQLSKTAFISDDVPYLPDYYLLVAIHWEFILRKSLTGTFANIAVYKQRMMAIPSVNKVFTEEYGS